MAMFQYLQLFHGRPDPREQLNDWGSEGPVIGPLEYVHTTYATDVKFGFFDKSQSDGWLTIVNGLIYYDGVYYGDWSSFTNLPKELTSRVIEFDQLKAALPPAPVTAPPGETQNLADLLTALNGFAFLALHNAKDPADLQRYLEQILAASNRAVVLYHQFYVLRLHGGIEPELIGPFDTEDDRDDRAKELRKENDEDVMLALNGPGSSIEIDAYSGGFFLDEESDEN
jgi:hypothetical protein